MARVLLALGADHELLAREISLWGHVIVAEVADAAAAREALGAGAEVAIVSASVLERELLGEADRNGVRLIVIAVDAADRARADALGALETVHPVSDLDRLSRFLAGPSQLPLGVRTEGGLLYAVCGAPGSPGASTLALNLAAELAAHSSVTLVDLDTLAPSLAALCGVETDTPGVAAAARLVDVDAFSLAEFQRLSAPVTERLRLLSGLSALEHWPELTAERVSGMLGALRAWSEVVVVDVGALQDQSAESLNDPFAPRRSASQRSALELAERIIVVGAADPISLARLVRAWPGLPREHRVELVIGKLRASALGVNPAAQVRSVCREFLGIQPAALLPFDARASDAALLRAAPLAVVAKRSALRRAIAAFAESVRPERAASVERRRGRRARSARVA